MDVTCKNFEDILPQVHKAVEASTFLSIDCEFSGLNTSPSSIKPFDTVRQYYEKVSKSSGFSLMQFGLSCFKYCEENDGFEHETYNFYIYRKSWDRDLDDRFMCQASCMDFLIEHNFDFNRLFREGISYMNSVEEEQYRGKLLEQFEHNVELKTATQKEQDCLPIPEDVQPIVDNACALLNKFYKQTKEQEVQLPKCNAFVRRLIYQTVKSQFASKISLETRKIDKESILFATKLKSNVELKEIEQTKYEDKLKELDNYVGFTKIIKIISESRKLVVGHNLFLDLVHTIDKFLHPLPQDYDEFKELASTMFPLLLDTKMMASQRPFYPDIKSTVLKNLLETLKVEPFGFPELVVKDEELCYKLEDDKSHEAGYDAFITGLCFLSMWSFLGGKKSHYKDLSLLDDHKNRLHLMRLMDNQFVHLDQPEVAPSRDHVFYLKFPSEWKQKNIVQLFSPYGNIFVSWINDSSAYVSLYKRDNAKQAYSALKKPGTKYFISKFQGDKQVEQKASPENPRKLKMSDEECEGTSSKIARICLQAKKSPVKSQAFMEDQNWS